MVCSPESMDGISVRQVLEVVGDFDALGGASLGLVAWELSVTEERVAAAWRRMLADGLLKPAGRDKIHGEQLWRLTTDGWDTRTGAGE
jgi:hypothetical protein